MPESGRKQLLRELYVGRSCQNKEFGLLVLLVARQAWIHKSKTWQRSMNCVSSHVDCLQLHSGIPGICCQVLPYYWTNVSGFDWCPYQVAGSLSCDSCYFIWHLAMVNVCSLWPVSYSGHRQWFVPHQWRVSSTYFLQFKNGDKHVRLPSITLHQMG